MDEDQYASQNLSVKVVQPFWLIFGLIALVDIVWAYLAHWILGPSGAHFRLRISSQFGFSKTTYSSIQAATRTVTELIGVINIIFLIYVWRIPDLLGAIKMEWNSIRRFLKPVLILVLILTIISACIAKMANFGWLTLIYGLFTYVPIVIAHIWIHVKLIRNSDSVDNSQLALVLFSHLALLLGFLFQYDVGDGSGSLAIHSLLYGSVEAQSHIPAWWSHSAIPILMNIVTFIPLAISWFLIGRKSFPKFPNRIAFVFLIVFFIVLGLVINWLLLLTFG